ncbi:MAG TPA: GatB/YqeY domain-containing protein, partial [Xanthobacteraceae bacterium]|nr:GatB/YqeY domain-containing protein [Xanthobacteraceae bacterium]
MLRDSINDALKDAMKSQDKRRVSTLRLINAAIKNAEIEARGAGKEALADDAILGVLQKMIKQRQESAELYEKGGRPELAAQEREEMEIISAYLPQQMSDLEAGSVIQQIVHEINAQGL